MSHSGRSAVDRLVDHPLVFLVYQSATQQREERHAVVLGRDALGVTAMEPVEDDMERADTGLRP